jgi:hypothetical protein
MGSHDIQVDPLLTADYRLEQDSPCIDAIPTAAGDPVTIDHEGVTRPIGAGFDMAASNMPPTSSA